MNPSLFRSLLEQGVWVLPHLVVLGVGAGLVWQLRALNPRAATWALAAFGLMALTAVAGPLTSVWFTQAFMGAPLGARSQSALLYSALSAIRAVVGLVALGLLIAALRRALLGPDPRP